MSYRSLLFVPGSRPERFEKAIASGADAVCIDLEDAVSADDKDSARVATLSFLGQSRAGVGVRLNSLKTKCGLRDAAALIETRAAPAFVLLPKITSAEEVTQARELLGVEAPAIWSLIETPKALFHVLEIAEAIGEKGGLMFGGADMSAALGSDMGWDALYYSRAAIVAAAAAVGCQAMDVPWLNVPDIDGMVAETHRIKSMGFSGRASIHPTHINPINTVFSPTLEDIRSAEEKLAAYEMAGGVLLHEGRLVEKPVLAAAKRILAMRDRPKTLKR